MVGLALTNGAEFIVSLLAVSICGAVAALINPGFTSGVYMHKESCLYYSFRLNLIEFLQENWNMQHILLDQFYGYAREKC